MSQGEAMVANEYGGLRRWVERGIGNPSDLYQVRNRMC